jgi:hypothetical protein
MTKLNPEVREVEIGIRELRPVKLYPLSFRDQTQASDLIGEAMQKLIEAQSKPDITFVKEILDLISRNADRILGLVMDKNEKGDDVLAEISNQQLLAIAEAVWDVNYTAIQKKIQSIVGTLEAVNQSQRMRQSPLSLEDIPSIESKISTEGAGAKAG